jgi:hypothetical protein
MEKNAPTARQLKQIDSKANDHELHRRKLTVWDELKPSMMPASIEASFPNRTTYRTS